jgi:uncharacterized RDD family membrane protein YckC
MKDTVIKEQAQKAFGKRIGAGFIDLVTWIILFVIAGIIFGKTTTTVHGSSKSVNVSLTGWPTCVFLLVMLAYFVLLEWRLGGTIGKLLLGVQVVDGKFKRLTLKQAIIRNILRVVDAFPYIVPYLTGIILIAGDEHKRRLGDRAANTLVVVKSGKEDSGSWELP